MYCWTQPPELRGSGCSGRTLQASGGAGASDPDCKTSENWLHSLCMHVPVDSTRCQARGLTCVLCLSGVCRVIPRKRVKKVAESGLGLVEGCQSLQASPRCVLNAWVVSGSTMAAVLLGLKWPHIY